MQGLRHPPQGDTTGWFLWTGDLLQDADFFVPWHATRAVGRCPDLAPLLDLPPGSRFIYSPDHLEVWEDASLLDA